ncbi:MAG: hypothetical protein PVH91_10890 [Pseudomonadales bacterium]|jgi:hypothetical protein
MRGSPAIALLLLILGGCVSAPKVDSFALPYFAYVPLHEAGIVDRRRVFSDVFCAVLRSNLEPEFGERPCEDFLHLDVPAEPEPTVPELDPKIPLRVIIVPGFLGDCLSGISTPFENARRIIEGQGVTTELVVVGGRASSAHNAAIVAERLNSLEVRQGPPVVLIGYSKGVSDILEALPLVSGGLDHIAALVSIAGVVNGSPIASEQSEFLRGLLDGLPMKDCPASAEDGDAIASLTYEHRQSWLQTHPLPPGPRYLSVAAYATLSGMSRVNRSSYKKLALVDGRNDGQLIYRDTLLPGSDLLAFANADHLAVALPFDADDGMLVTHAVNRNAYPRAVLLKSLLITIQRAMRKDAAPGLDG